MSVTVGIAGLGTAFPEGRLSAEELGALAGIPGEVVREKMGLREKRVGGPDDHPSDLAAAAAENALADAERRLGAPIHRDEIGAVIYFGSPHKDYPVWLAAPRIQHLLGAERAFSFEVGGVSAGAPIALRMAADMMAADPALGTVVLAAASREASLLDYTNRSARFMFNFGDGAAAAVLRRGLSRNLVLASSFRTDGSFSEHVRVPAGGTRLSTSAETVARGLHTLDVHDLEGMKERLDPVSLERFTGGARDAIRRSDRDPRELAFLATLHTKRSIFDLVLDELGLEEENSLYLDRYGHMSAVDPIVALKEGEELGRLRDGMLAVALSAGTGYTWAATALQWGPAPDPETEGSP
jgi:3-oxoacyl-[acyl-carrier-protein] synthase III